MAEAAHILTIDDDPTVRNVFARLLEAVGYVVSEAEDGASGLRKVREDKPDLVLCDLRMPGMDGLDVLSRIREHDRNIPVIVVSGAGSIDDAVEALKRGAWDYIVKPVLDITLLRSALERALERSALRRQNEAQRIHLETLNGQLADALGQLRHDQEAAKRTQFQLLPDDGQTFGDYRFTRRLFPSLYLSGDFIDYFAIDEQRVGFYMADVSGHGAASAFVTVILKTLVGQYLTAFHHKNDETILRPATTVARIDQDIQQLQLDKHLTMFYGILNHETRQLAYCSGGQYPYPVLLHDGAMQLLDRPGKAVGLFPGAEFACHHAVLPHGARLLLVSDGVLEVLPQETVSDKNAALQQALSCNASDIDGLADALGIAATRDLQDDVALLLLDGEAHARD